MPRQDAGNATKEAQVTDAVAERPADVAEAEATPATPRSKRNTAPIQITVPLDLKAQIHAAAQAENGKSEARWVLENIAADLGYTLPEAQVRGGARPSALIPRSLSAEQKRERFDAARTLLMALDNGDIDLEAIKQKLGLTK